MAKSRMACSTALAQAIADAGAGVERVLVVALDQALGGGVVADRQAGGVQQPVEDGEVGEEAVGEDAVEVELEVGELDEAGAVAQQAEHAAVGDEAVEFVVRLRYSCTRACADMRRRRLVRSGLRSRPAGSR